MNNVLDFMTAHASWLPPIGAVICLAVWFAIDDRWEAYTRRKNYEELKTLHDLRGNGVITQAEFDEKKRELLGT